jgi:hypothetical protein
MAASSTAHARRDRPTACGQHAADRLDGAPTSLLRHQHDITSDLAEVDGDIAHAASHYLV